MIFNKKQEKDVDLPVRKMWAVSKVAEGPHFDMFKTKEEAEACAKRSAQRSDAIFAVYEVSLIGSAWPQASTYQDLA